MSIEAIIASTNANVANVRDAALSPSPSRIRHIPPTSVAQVGRVANDAPPASLSIASSLVRDATGLATTAGYGPRFLHSTGQLHKGGAPVGRFLQITSDHLVDRAIPGWPYTFGRLIDAQAQGDREALAAHGVPVLRVHLGPTPERDLAILVRAVEAVVGGGRRRRVGDD